MGIFLKIGYIFEKKEKIRILFLTILCLLGALAETLSIGVILPFMNIISDPLKVKKYKLIGDVVKNLSGKEIVAISCVLLLLIFLLKNCYLFFLYYLQARFIYNRQIVLSKRLMMSYFKKPYSFFFDKNTAELQRNISYSLPNMITNVVLFSIYLLTELLIVSLVFILLFITDIVSTLIIFLILGFTILLIYFKFKKTTLFYGNQQQSAYAEMIKWINQSIGGIKEIKVKENYYYYTENFATYGFEYARATTFSNILSQAPRFLIEVIAVASFAIIIVVNVINGVDISTLISKLTLFAMGAFRLMPSFIRIMTYVNSIRFNSASLNSIYNDLIESKYQCFEREKIKDLQFNKTLELKDISFKYDTAENILYKNINIKIKKGSKVGIIGASGQGKSTLLDIILGLLRPNGGSIEVDGLDIYQNMSGWHKLVGYIPQMVYLIDDTILNNITVGVEKKDILLEKVWKVLEIVKLNEFVQSLPNSLETLVGENGVCLSGGQRQRIAIARALYSDPQVLIMDEATSALDSDTESYITDAIDNIDDEKTFIIVAHRLTTLKKCDRIYKIENGNITLQGEGVSSK